MTELSARDRRRANDYAAVQALCAASGDRIAIVATTGAPPSEYHLRFFVRTLVDASGTVDVQPIDLMVMLPKLYPNPGAMPSVHAVGPIFHPHFFHSGNMCLGSAPMSTLGAFVEWVGRVLVFDPACLNPSSPANSSAMAWVKRLAGQLPLDSIDFRVPVTRGGVPAAPPAPVAPPRPRIAWGVG